MTEAERLAARVMTTIRDRQDYLVDYAKPMGALVVRWSAAAAAHAGKAALAALDLALAALAPHAARPLAMRGFVSKAKKTTRYAAPKPMAPAGRKLLGEALATYRTLPREATFVYLADAVHTALPPERAAIYLSLAADHTKTFCTGGGFLAIAFPLATLGDPAWRALGDALVTVLDAEVAWLSPAVWLAPHNLFNASTNDLDGEDTAIDLFAADPQLDVPSFYASRSPFSYDELDPAPLAGLLAPAWQMWLAAPLAKQVKRYGGTVAKVANGARRYAIEDDPPFAMTAARYLTWRARWAELAPVHVTPRDEQIDDVARTFATRFSADSLAALGATWRAARAARTSALRLAAERKQQLDALEGGKLVAYANAIAKEMSPELAWYFLPKLVDLVAGKHVTPGEALVWLDVCEQYASPPNTLRFDQVLDKAALVAVAAGDHGRAIDLLHRGRKAGTVEAMRLKRDPEWRALRKDSRFAKLLR